MEKLVENNSIEKAVLTRQNGLEETVRRALTSIIVLSEINSIATE